MNRFFTAILIVSLAAAAGCGNGNNENSSTNNASNNTQTNNDNAQTNSDNAQTNSSTNNENTQTNTTPNNMNTRQEPYITRFRYYEEKQSALGSVTEGFTIGVLGLTIANEDGNSKSLDAADAQEFETTYMTADTIDAMRNGWGCREVSTGGDMGMGGADMGAGDVGSGPLEESTFWFEAYVQEDGSNREIQEITGCVLDGDQDVQAIIDALTALGDQYL